jgi:hypothetical protein
MHALKFLQSTKKKACLCESEDQRNGRLVVQATIPFTSRFWERKSFSVTHYFQQGRSRRESMVIFH